MLSKVAPMVELTYKEVDAIVERCLETILHNIALLSVPVREPPAQRENRDLKPRRSEVTELLGTRLASNGKLHRHAELTISLGSNLLSTAGILAVLLSSFSLKGSIS